MSARGPLVCIVGPTASGKSSLADAVALELGSCVVSVDAMQVYRGMDVGTAKTPPSERQCPLLMVDVADVDEDYSVALYQRDARECIDRVLAQGKVPVLCGGTGLYLDAVIDEMSFPKGKVGDDARSTYEAYAEEYGSDALHAQLAERDPASARLIHPHNVRRVVRALEMLDEGTSYAVQNAHLKDRAAHYQAVVWGIRMERSRLYERIDERVDGMFERGLVDEVAGLCALGLSHALTSRQAIGYKEVVDALEGRCTMDEAREEIKRRSRRYAKRQMSWFRREGRVCWIDYDTTSEEEAVDMIVSHVRHQAGMASDGTA